MSAYVFNRTDQTFHAVVDGVLRPVPTSRWPEIVNRSGEPVPCDEHGILIGYAPDADGLHGPFRAPTPCVMYGYDPATDTIRPLTVNRTAHGRCTWCGTASGSDGRGRCRECGAPMKGEGR